MHCTVYFFSPLFHFTPCFDVRNVIFREYTKVFTSAARHVVLHNVDHVPYVEKCQSEGGGEGKVHVVRFNITIHIKTMHGVSSVKIENIN
jgi:hypothetical protein